MHAHLDPNRAWEVLVNYNYSSVVCIGGVFAVKYVYQKVILV